MMQTVHEFECGIHDTSAWAQMLLMDWFETEAAAFVLENAISLPKVICTPQPSKYNTMIKVVADLNPYDYIIFKLRFCV